LSSTLRFLPDAVQEFENAIVWYREKSPNLGEQFITAFESTIDRIGQFPDAFPIYRKSARQAFVPRFPYGVFYVHEASNIQILAVFNLKQDPKKMTKRV
jgi:plasmid stabilization system protein ParE